MATTLISNGSSTFRIKRPLNTSNGFTSDVDPTVRMHLSELSSLLGKRIFDAVAQNDVIRAKTEALRHAQAQARTKAEAAEQAQAFADAKTKAESEAEAKLQAAYQGLKKAESGSDQGAINAARSAVKAAEADHKTAQKDAQRASRVAEQAADGAKAAEFAAEDAEADLQDAKAAAAGSGIDSPRLVSILEADVTPKRAGDGPKWGADSLADRLSTAVEDEEDFTLAELMDQHAKLSKLKYEFQSYYHSYRLSVDYNLRAVLDYPAVLDYVVARGYHFGFREVTGLKNFVFNNANGAQSVVKYAAASAARSVIVKEHLQVPNFDNDNSEFIKQIASSNLPLSSAAFKTKLNGLVGNVVFDGNYLNLIKNANVGQILPSMIPQLVKYMKSYEKKGIPITAQNVNAYLPIFISQIQGGTVDLDEPTEADIAESDRDFDVQFFEDDNSLIEISASAVKCASQLFYSMVLGDELAVFDTVNYFTHRFLLRGGVELQDSRLRDDLQQYVFSNRFTDLSTGKVMDRSRPAERQMFYRQVFNTGRAPVGNEIIVNDEFPRLWKVLILESAKFIERAQAAFNPESYVSKQNVMQAVEDLQYNLSTHCTGMVNVFSPLIYAELNFIVQRIFMHPEVRRQVVPAGGTWWKVVETLYMGMNHTRPKSTVLYNKAKLGHDIIRSIADYNPATFDDDAVFSSFISNVDAFITTQSILQEALTDDLANDREDEGDDYDSDDSGSARPTNGSMKTSMPGAASGAAAGTGQDEWDF